VEVFGSYATGIYLPASDIDITIIKSGKSTQSLMDSLYSILKSQSKVQVIDRINKTRVPIIKLIDRATGIHIDISFNNSCLVMVNNIKQIALQYPHFKHIVLIMKYFLKLRDYNDTYRGGIGSTLLQLMVYAYLQYKYKELNYDISKLMLSEVLIDFVRFYSEKFNWSHLAISVIGKGCFVKKDGLYFGSNLSIINPLDVTLDVGKPSFNIHSVLIAMKKTLNYMLYSVEEHKSYLLMFFGGIL
jgi:non-canonical poly(A) RNA polymerase PAPD5/7